MSILTRNNDNNNNDGSVDPVFAQQSYTHV